MNEYNQSPNDTNILQKYIMKIEESLYKCDHCYAVFTQKNGLTIHNKLHTGNFIHK